MFREIFRFELRQQLGSPVAWSILLAFAAIGVLEMIGPGVQLLGAHDGVVRNAPMVIANAVSMFCILGTLAAGSFVAAAALRDYDHRTAQLLLSMPVGRRAYLGGRFAAAWLLVLLTMLACMVGIAVGNLLPGMAPTDASNAAAYVWAFLIVALPGTLFVCALLFGLAMLTRSLLATYVGVACLLVLLFLSRVLMHNAASQALAAIVDPFGFHTLKAVTRYWSTAEFNTQLPTLTGWLLLNRVLWSGVSVALLGGLLAARWNLLGLGKVRRKAVIVETREARTVSPQARTLSAVSLPGRASGWRVFAHWFAFDVAQVLRSAPFLILLLFGLISVALNLGAQPTMMGVTSMPVTADVVGLIGDSLQWLLAITLVFYAGELVWRDHDLRVAGVCDAMPWPDAAAVAAKAGVLVAVVVLFLLCGAVVGVGWQLLHGYTHIEPGLYLGALAMQAIPYVLLAVLCLAVQIVCGNRFVAYLLTVLWLVWVRFAAPLLGWRDHLFLYGTIPAIPHSSLNGYSGFLSAVLWFGAYWALLAIALLVVGALFWMRGIHEPWRLRLRAAIARCRGRVCVVLAVALLAFVACGGWVFYNTHVLNQPYDGARVARQKAQYEKNFGHYRNAAQPRIASEKLTVAIYPRQRALDIRGTYALVNRHATPIDTLLVAYPRGFKVESVSLPARVVEQQAEPHFVVYRLQAPLAPGASMTFGFHLTRALRGFANEPEATYLVANGSFFDNLVGPDGSAHNVLPHIGYQPYLELANPRARRRFGLPPVASTMPAADAPGARNANAMAADADWVHADVTLSTSLDQTAITSGILQRSWVDQGRRYFHYVTEAPLPNALPFLSARYAVRHVAWGDVGIDIHYDPDEAQNIDRIARTLRDALAYYTQYFGPYPYQTLRVAVVPYNYGFAAQAYPGVLVVRESGPAGPQSQAPRAGAVDPLYLLLAHEISHEWWAIQELPANVRGANMISESFAQYSELMLAQQRYGKPALQPALTQLLDEYLTGRHRTRLPESPLVDVGGGPQGYIYYDKGALAFYTLAEYLGEATVNQALRRFLDATRFKGPPYPTAEQFLGLLESDAGPQWRPLIDDLFRKIVLFDNRILGATATKLADGKYRVTMRVHAAKDYADDEGKQTRAKLDMPVEIGVFAAPPNGIGLGKPLYLAKYPVKDGDSAITVIVDAKPAIAGIDPFDTLTDIRPDDNRAQVTLR